MNAILLNQQCCFRTGHHWPCTLMLRLPSVYHPVSYKSSSEHWLVHKCDIYCILKKRASCCFVSIPVNLNTPEENAAIFAWSLSTTVPVFGGGWRWEQLKLVSAAAAQGPSLSR